MKTTRTITVSEKVFTSEDLRRISAIFKKQTSLAKTPDHRSSMEYQVQFEDNTTVEADSPELFTDESLASTSRPVGIKMSFHNFPLNRHMVLSLEHGSSSPHRNSAQVTAEEQAWLLEKFQALQNALDMVRPQSFLWLKKHRYIPILLITMGAGSLFDLIMTLLVYLSGGPVKTSSLSPGLVSFMEAIPPPLHYILPRIPALFMGFLLSGYIYSWLESAWPNVEFDFGVAHFRKELNKRRRLYLVATLIIVPVAITLALDALKAPPH